MTALAFNPVISNTLVAAGATDGKVYIWDVQGNTLPQRTLVAGDVHDPVRTLAWSSDGQYLAAGYNDVNASILIWKI
ncbi:hypothetical protein [Ktedonosporobacter rubrisoli]|uniref:hypothetical protein n=1 Tax=Ktedonosporobacter rubrisoli TaxID=2509675 RepID=UPI0013EE9B56|nr:hypothetical protein [Ktedonosporobacter rubrisoli]